MFSFEKDNKEWQEYERRLRYLELIPIRSTVPEDRDRERRRRFYHPDDSGPYGRDVC